MRAIAVELSETAEEPEELLGTFSAERGHACPKIDVRAAAFRDDRLLLVRGRDDGLWTLPGGWAEVGESPRRAVEKELREESGYSGRAVTLAAVVERDLLHRGRFPFYAWKLYFLCELDPGEPAPPQASEIHEVGFFDPGGLPELSVRTPIDHLGLVLARVRDPALPTAFE